jgi:preprotein translocase subunit YajC
VNGSELLLAQTGGGGAGGLLGFVLPFAALLLLMYALVIRPQQRQQREHRTMLAQVQRGDLIVTSGGLHGKVTGISDDVLTVEIAERVRVKISKSAISSRTAGGGESKS